MSGRFHHDSRLKPLVKHFNNLNIKEVFQSSCMLTLFDIVSPNMAATLKISNVGQMCVEGSSWMQSCAGWNKLSTLRES